MPRSLLRNATSNSVVAGNRVTEYTDEVAKAGGALTTRGAAAELERLLWVTVKAEADFEVTTLTAP